MTHQVAVTVRAPLLAGHEQDVQALLRRIRREGPRQGSFPFASMSEVHFARVFMLEQVRDLDGDVIGSSLVYMADVDGPAADHLRSLCRAARAGVEELFGHCTGFPAARSEAACVDWLVSHQLAPAAYYVHTVGRTVRGVHDEARLRDQTARIVDGARIEDDGTGARGVRRQIQQLVLAHPDLAWAATSPPGPGLAYQLGKLREVVTVVVPAIVLLPLLLPVTAVWLLVVRALEATDDQEDGPPDPEHVAEVQSYEDFGAQNAFTAVGFVKPGLVRGVTMRVALRGLDLACRQVFHRDNLAGIRSIHFARWLPLDDGRRMVFASSYDGSLESYMDDFIDRVSWGVNLVFSNGVGYPRTRWLVLEGARDELRYKRYLRRHQVPTVVFYSAYERLPAPNLDANTRLRRGMSRALDSGDAGRWLALL